MIAEIGHFALGLALILACAQAFFPLAGAARNNALWMNVAEPAAVGQFAFIAVAFACLTYLYVVSDFSVATVAANSNSALPLLYKISGTWGNHEGSMVLWVLILSVFGMSVALFGGNLPPALRARVLSVQGMIAAGFLLFIILTSNPFFRVFPVPEDGRDLNPLLQDPGLAFHPPFLYLGYVGFSMAFSFAIAALIEGRVDAAWARWVRPWTLAAWCFLTLGIAMGSWWSYYTLGWGGWWAWDPVENASFMPWLAGTALLHSAIVTEKRDALKSWTILLAILTFSLSLIGTFLVRSGVITSVHSFASDPARGLFILLLLAIAIGGSLFLYALRAPKLKAGGLFSAISREGSLVLNNFLLSVGAATVFIGTLYPLFLDSIGGDKVSVGPPYFNATFVPLMVPMILVMGIGPLLSWKRADLAGALARLKVAAFISVVVAFAAFIVATGGSVLAYGGIALATWLFAATLVEFAERVQLFKAPWRDSLRRAAALPRAAYGMTIAHAGIAVVIAGITVSSAWRIESVQVMRPGQSIDVAGYTFTFDGVTETEGPNYSADQGRMTVTHDGREVAVMLPEKRLYPVQGMPITAAAIRTNGFYDLYATLGDKAGEDGWTTRIYYNPLVPWIFGGAVIMFLGGLVSLTDRRYRVGAPARKQAATGAAANSPAARA
jgi:cytochrome c-type biogenesis protein CcmF